MINYLYRRLFGKRIMVIFYLWMFFSFGIALIMISQLSKSPYYHAANFSAKTNVCIQENTAFTIDNAHRDSSILDTNFSEHDPEHKSFNVIKLDNGQFAAQPNNRVIWRDSSLTPENLLTPDFKVCTQNYKVETEPKWSVGHTEEWQYKTLDEESET